MQSKIKELKCYSYKDINVYVEIDYVKNNISITDSQGNPKHFVFADRGVQYMNGWRLVLRAIDYAVSEAKKEYEANLAKVSLEAQQKVVNLMGVIFALEDEMKTDYAESPKTKSDKKSPKAKSDNT